MGQTCFEVEKTDIDVIGVKLNMYLHLFSLVRSCKTHAQCWWKCHPWIWIGRRQSVLRVRMFMEKRTCHMCVDRKSTLTPPYMPMRQRDIYQRVNPQYAPASEREVKYEDGDVYYTPLSSPSARLAWPCFVVPSNQDLCPSELQWQHRSYYQLDPLPVLSFCYTVACIISKALRARSVRFRVFVPLYHVSPECVAVGGPFLGTSSTTMFR